MTYQREFSTRQRAEDFVRVIRMIGKPPPTEEDEQLQSGFRPGITIRLISRESGAKQRSVPGEFADIIRRRVNELVDPSLATTSYKDHIRGLVDEQLDSPIMRMLGGDVIIGGAGVNLEKNDFGMFEDDLAKVREAEETVLRHQIAVAQGLVIPELRDGLKTKIERWVDEFKVAYNIDPLA